MTTATALPDKQELTSDAARTLTRIRLLVVMFIVAIVISGATAIPLVWEMEFITSYLPAADTEGTGTKASLIHWLYQVKNALVETDSKYPFLAYGYDWLAFGHFMIGLVFIGAYRDPIRNIWLFSFGMWACALVIPYALIFGEVRHIPLGWRLIDCAFGILGFPLVWYARRLTDQLTKQLSL